VMNKPVFTTRTAGESTAQLAHADILGDKALLYTCSNVEEKLHAFDRRAAGARTDWNAYLANSPATIMAQFMRLTSGHSGPILEGSAATAALDAKADKVAASTCDGTPVVGAGGVHCVCLSQRQCQGSHCTHGRKGSTSLEGYSMRKCLDCNCV